MKFIRRLFLIFGLLLIVLSSIARYYYLVKSKPATASNTKESVAYKNSKIFNKIVPALVKYSTVNKFSKQYIFLVDMHIASGKNRFFVYDIKKDSIVNSGLVTHGRCNQNWLNGRKYENEVGCGCTSLGKYKIGNMYNGRFGKAYKLYGLDSTNSNAFKRFVVLHSHRCVPNNEVDPYPICQSDGCPTVSPAFLNQLSKYIDSSAEPVLLYIYDHP